MAGSSLLAPWGHGHRDTPGTAPGLLLCIRHHKGRGFLPGPVFLGDARKD